MPRTPTTSSWGFPPETREIQLDEKWSFVAKKEKNCDPVDPNDDDDDDSWDFADDDPEPRLVLVVVSGARTVETTETIIAEAKERLGGKAPHLITSDQCPAYASAIESAFSEPVPPPGNRKPVQPRILPERRLADGLNSATVHKHRENHRVVSEDQRPVFGTQDGL